MAHLLNIYQGSTIVQLGQDGTGFRYTPRTPADGALTVTESATLFIAGDTMTEIQIKVRAIEAMFEAARNYQTKRIGERVYLGFQPDSGDTTAQRSEILIGTLAQTDELLGNDWLTLKIKVMATWTRRAWWEGPEAQIALMNPNRALVFAGEVSDPQTVLSGYANITGVSAINTTNYLLYFVLQQGGFPNELDLTIFADADLTVQVGHIATTTSVGAKTIIADGGSGLGGTITIDAAATFAAASARWEYPLFEPAAIDNHTDGAHANYAVIGADRIAGTLDTPLRLEITNAYNSASRAYNFMIGLNRLSDPEFFTHVLEAESASGGTTTADATCSNGNRKDCSWTGTGEAELLNWTLSTALLNMCAGNYFRQMLRFSSVAAYTDCWVRFRIKLALTTIWESAPVKLDTAHSLQDLGVLQLPPYLVGAGDLYPLNLVLYAQRATAGTHTLNMDYLQLFALDGWRKLAPRGYGLVYGARLVDDGIDDLIYTDGWPTAGKTGHYKGSGDRLMGRPGVVQRIVLLHDSDTGSAAIDRTLTVKAYYRPRRLTI